VGDFISDMSRTDFVKQFVRAFLEPGYFARFIGFLGNLVSNVGPLKNSLQAAAGQREADLFHAYRDHPIST
jgi:hypothetical protein